jgi:UDP-N-acetylglucosamine:LPS N-acetylglucosamine transferase
VAEPSVLVVTSSGASPAAVVPVLAAIEAAGIRVRAIDVGAVGGGGTGVADRMRRALAGEGAERKLKKELELSPPDAVIAFDPHAALALTVVRDQVQNPAPVIAVVGDLEPVAAWSQSDADRFLAVDEIAAVALADAGVEGDRILVVGAIGERAFAEAAAHDRLMLRSRFKLSGKVALVEVAGLGAELTGQLSLQLSLLDGGSQITFLFDAGNDADAAAVLRRQVPALGLKAKLFGSTPDAPLLWRAADAIVARPRAEVVSRVMLLGGRLVALVDDSVPHSAATAAALEARKRAIASKGLLMLSSALESAFGGTPPSATDDGADQIADIVAAVASDKRGVIDERLSAVHAATRDKVHRANSAAQAAAAQTAAAGDLEDLGGGGGGFADAVADLPDKAELERLRGEVARRVSDLNKQMAASRDAATDATEKAKGARARGAVDEAIQLERKADGERARMHGLLSELATLESELKDLERSIKALGDIPRTSSSASSASTSSSGAGGGAPRAEAPPRRAASIDDELARLKRHGGGGPTPKPPASSAPGSGAKKPPADNVDDELAALKKKMQGAPPKKKP